MKLVVLESPFAAPSPEALEKNLDYLRRCLRDSFLRGEYPYASHGLYTQPGVLNDRDPEERRLGMQAGFAWGKHAVLRAVYIDRGVSPGMEKGIQISRELGTPVAFRSLLLDADPKEIQARYEAQYGKDPR